MISADAVTVYVVDDHAQVRAQLVDLVDHTEGFIVVGSSEDAPRAIREIVALAPRVALIDGYIGGGDGLQVCRALASQAPDVACVIVTAGVGVEWGPVDAAEAGAAAFLLKQLSDFPLVETIAKVASGERLLDGYLKPLRPVESLGEGSAGGRNR